MASCCASGPGRSMQKLSACKKRDWLIHRLRSTSSVCMIAIWPAGPPKEMKPSFSQKRNAAAKEGSEIESAFSDAFVIDVGDMNTVRRSTLRRAGEVH